MKQLPIFLFGFMSAFSLSMYTIVIPQEEDYEAKLLDKDSICTCQKNELIKEHQRNVTKILGE